MTFTRFLSSTRGVCSVVTFRSTTCSCTIPLCLTLRAKAAGTMSVSFVRYTAVPFMRSGAPGCSRPAMKVAQANSVLVPPLEGDAPTFPPNEHKSERNETDEQRKPASGGNFVNIG